MGVFEFEAFAKGTMGIVNILADLSKDKGAITIIGGGDSVAATEQSGRAADMSHISTGGGASLELLEGKVLPGVAALDDNWDSTCLLSKTRTSGDDGFGKYRSPNIETEFY